MVARTARMPGSAKAAIRSAARSCGDAPTLRVVGYSTGSRSNSARNRRMACSWIAGNRPGTANDGETTATRSPGFSFDGTASISSGYEESHHPGDPDDDSGTEFDQHGQARGLEGVFGGRPGGGGIVQPRPLGQPDAEDEPQHQAD